MPHAVPSEQLLQLFACEFAIPQYFGEQPRPYGFARVYRHHRRAAVGVTQEMMTTFDPNGHESGALQCGE